MAADTTTDGSSVGVGYKTYLENSFQGEVYGEALFRTMAELCPEPDRARKLGVLRQLERQTKELLREALKEAGGSVDESSERVSAGETLGRRLAKMPWLDVMRGFERELERFVRDFELAERLAPPGKERLLKHVTAHERALLQFSIRELSGDQRGDSLEGVVALLTQ